MRRQATSKNLIFACFYNQPSEKTLYANALGEG